MAISPPGDIVLDVMRAADPRQQQRAAARLQRIAAQGQAVGGGRASSAAATATATSWTAPSWNRALRQAALGGGGTHTTHAAPMHGPIRLGKAPDAAMLAVDGSLLSEPAAAARDATTAATALAAATSSASAAPRRSGGLRQAYAGLEGVLIANMLQGMLGTGRSGLFGSGLAGEYWKSMLAQAVAGQVAQGGGLGVAKSLLRSNEAAAAIGAAVQSSTGAGA